MMVTYYEQMDEDLLKLISGFRNNIIDGNENSSLIRKKEFFYKNGEYLLISIIPNLPHIQMLALYGQGKKIQSGYIIIGSYCIPINKKIIKKEIGVIRKYNSYYLSRRYSCIPNYETNFSPEFVNDFKEILNLFLKSGEYLLKKGKTNKEELIYYNIFCRYINYCKYIDDRRIKFIEYKKKIKCLKSEDGIGTPELYV